MSAPYLDRLTPRATPRTRLFTAACIWSAVGICLCSRGLLLVQHMPGLTAAGVILGGIITGALKSRMIFDRAGASITAHIHRKPNPACLGGLFSLKNWGLIACMVLLGGVIKRLAIPDAIKSVVYILVGTGLIYSSRILWQAWRKALKTR
jgi:hypothetical protein